MAEPGNSTAIVSSPAAALTLENTSFEIKSFDAAGNGTTYMVPFPTSSDFAEWSIVTQVGMLKRGPWNKLSIPDIYWGLAYAHRIGADVMKGDLFPTGDGRFGTSNKFKIRKAMETGKIKGWDVAITDTGRASDKLKTCVQQTDLECTVTLDVEGLNKPIVRKALLSRWYKPSNPNWKDNPEHMLELNTLAHACEYIADTGTGPEEAPPLEPSPIQQSSPAPTKSMIDSLKDEVVADRTAKSSQGEGETTSLEGQLVESLKAVEAKKSAPPVTVEK